MKAMIATRQGDADVLQATDLPKPKAGPGQVLVRIHASSVNPIDIKVRRANLPMAPRAFPAVLQSDLAGVIEAVGPGVTRFVPGDAVFGFAGGFHGPEGDIPGALAEYAAVDAHLIAKKPETVDFRTAAALPLVAVTAWKALFHKVSLQPGLKVLITGGAGGVGQMAVQLAALAGAEVTAVTRTATSAEVARAAGARTCVDLGDAGTEAQLMAETGGHGFDVIFDTVGGPVLDAAFRLVRPGGDVITVAGAASHALASLYLKGANLHMQLVLAPIMFGTGRPEQGRILENIARLVDEGRLVSRIDPERFALADAAAAHRRLEAGEARGKLVIDIA